MRCRPPVLRFRTQYPEISLTLLPDGSLLLNGEPLGALTPHEYDLLGGIIDDIVRRQDANA